MGVQGGSDGGPRWERWGSKVGAMGVQGGSDGGPRWERWGSKVGAMGVQGGSDEVQGPKSPAFVSVDNATEIDVDREKRGIYLLSSVCS